MNYLLDTNACIRYINGRAPKLRQKLATVPLQNIFVSTITKAEMFYGSAKSQTPEISRAKQLEFLETIQSLSFDEAAAITYGSMRMLLERNGQPISQNDMLIAAVALSGNLILVTHNIREFGRIQGLQIEDWEV